MISSLVGKWLTKKALIWTGVAVLGAATIPAIGASTHHLKAGVTHRTMSHSSHKATTLTSHKALSSASSHGPGFPLALEGGSARPSSIHSSKLTSSKTGKSAAKLTSSKKKPTSLHAVSSTSMGGQTGTTHATSSGPVAPSSTSVGPLMR